MEPVCFIYFNLNVFEPESLRPRFSVRSALLRRTTPVSYSSPSLREYIRQATVHVFRLESPCPAAEHSARTCGSACQDQPSESLGRHPGTALRLRNGCVGEH